MSETTTFLIVNAFLVLAVFGSLVWLLGHHGIRKGVKHDLAIIRRRAIALERRTEPRRDMAA
jgi:type IV secretory pathway TrbD component